ncbi:PREDICTED: uncharacterized protein LOC109157027 [Ipomoea nil]|uniref:uncharacterized protein LOC109157027 n=1 Tax=Ipomoea nil TaxID=35883 RepID=UPI0009017C37|nr:PREDICTED: uncharacterized protein LOC109157027 [Ipomoea nil]
MVEGEAMPKQEKREPPSLSFRDAVAGKTIAFVNPTLGDQDDGDSSDEDSQREEDDPLCPIIRLTKEEKAAIREPCGQALIIKVWGKRVGYSFLMRKLCALWRPKGSFEMVAIDNDYFLVKFGSRDDLDYAKFEGQWMILDHYLIVKEWRPNFDPMADKTEKVLVFTLKGRRRSIAYEGLHLVCFNCGTYGHSQDFCPAIVTNAPSETEVSQEVLVKTAAKQNPVEEAMASKPYGSWMVVTKPERCYTQRLGARDQRTGEVAKSQGQSWFQPLDGLRDEDGLEGEAGNMADVVRGDERVAIQTAENKKGSQTVSTTRRQRRANVVVHEKQIANQKEATTTSAAKGKEKENGSHKAQRSGPSRAAEEDEHVVVLGSQGG